MFEIEAEVTINKSFLDDVKKASTVAIKEAAEAVRGDLILSQTMPFDTGNLQNESTYVDDSKADSGEVSLVSTTPYARRLYYNPQFNFRTDKNPNAGGRWLDPYLKDGAKGDYFRNALSQRLGVRLKKWIT